MTTDRVQRDTELTEPQLVALFEEARITRQQLLSEALSLESVMWDYQKKIQELQRIRLTAANAEAKPQRQASFIKNLQNETGLNVEQINYALNLLKDLQKTAK